MHTSTELALPLEPRSSSASNEQYANSKKIAAHIATLLNLFWTTSEPQALRDATTKAWLEDLREFTADVVGDACRDWRRNHSKRPHIADIRQRCVRTPQPHVGQLAGPVTAGFTHQPISMAEAELHRQREQRFAEAEAARDAFARKYGYENYAAVSRSGLGDAEIVRRGSGPFVESTEIAARGRSDDVDPL